MMQPIELIRSFLYPIGFLANLLFGARFLFQWIQSERKKKSMVTPFFWILSLSANILMGCHALIQLQYPVCLIQTLNAVIAWRNLSLLKQTGRSTFKKTLILMMLASAFVSLLFFAQGWMLNSSYWMRSPVLPWNQNLPIQIHFGWHLIGLFGMVLFASRFWIQWWLAEKHQKSHLSQSFWWISLFGAILSTFYFIRLHDSVNLIGSSFGLLPYIRNLMILKKSIPEKETSKGLFLFAGETSGDLLGGKLVEALRQEDPSLEISGVGGPHMRKAGMKITHPMERFQVMGFSDVLKSLPRLYGDYRKIRNQILQKQPEGVVLIDYPDFNMHLAKALRKKGYKGKLIHYVCPSVWAWRKKRVHSLAATLDCLLSILPFEKEYFQNTSLPVQYVGHPLIGAIDSYIYDNEYPFPKDRPILAIFPGSRRQEIALNLPLQWQVAQQMKTHYVPVISVARPELMEEIQKHVDDSAIFVPQDKRYELMRAASLALATSGTIVLEIGLHALPTVVTYQLASLNYLLGRYLFRIHLPFYTLVNIICNCEVFPEFIHKTLSVDEIADALHKLEANSESCKQKCRELRKHLLDQDASREAAKKIEELRSARLNPSLQVNK